MLLGMFITDCKAQSQQSPRKYPYWTIQGIGGVRHNPLSKNSRVVVISRARQEGKAGGGGGGGLFTGSHTIHYFGLKSQIKRISGLQPFIYTLTYVATISELFFSVSTYRF